MQLIIIEKYPVLHYCCYYYYYYYYYYLLVFTFIQGNWKNPCF